MNDVVTISAGSDEVPHVVDPSITYEPQAPSSDDSYTATASR